MSRATSGIAVPGCTCPSTVRAATTDGWFAHRFLDDQEDFNRDNPFIDAHTAFAAQAIERFLAADIGGLDCVPEQVVEMRHRVEVRPEVPFAFGGHRRARDAPLARRFERMLNRGYL